MKGVRLVKHENEAFNHVLNATTGGMVFWVQSLSRWHDIGGYPTFNTRQDKGYFHL